MSSNNPKSFKTTTDLLAMQIGVTDIQVPPMRQLTPRLDSLEMSRLAEEGRLTALEQGQTTQDTANQTALASEANLRANADTAEVSARNTAISTAVSAEATTRASADTTNANAISAEATVRANADTAEVTARNAAITSAVATEATARTSADTALQTQIDAIKAKATQNKRGIAVGAMLLGATQSITVTWPAPFADANYNVIPVLSGSTTLLANVGIKGIVSRAAASCVVLVQASGVLATGATLDATGIHD